jgi:probable rRNA maturation factor
LESGSPEPSRRSGASATTEAARETPNDARLSPASYLVTVIDEQAHPVDGGRLERLAVHVLDARDVPPELELSVTCVDVARITELNEAHLGGHGATDVLAFPIDAPDQVVDGVPGLLGDVVLCPEVAERQAPDHGRTASGELDLLLVHGILHLLGHDHARADERADMFALTDALLADFPTPAAPKQGERQRSGGRGSVR